MNCFFCKKSGHTVYQCPTCPPCAHCKKKGHKSAACHQKPRLVYRTPKPVAPVVPVVLLSLDDDDEPPLFDEADLCAGLDRLRVPLCDRAAVDLEAEEWAKQWAVGAEYQPLPFGADEDERPPPALAAAMLREAAASFPAATGVGSDNIGPRACTRLSDCALGALAVILIACERAGRVDFATTLLEEVQSECQTKTISFTT